VRDEMELESAIDDVFALDDEALVERFVPEDQFCVPVLAGQALGALEVFRTGCWDRTPVGRHARAGDLCAARLSPTREASVLRWQLRLARPWVAKDRPASKWW